MGTSTDAVVVVYPGREPGPDHERITHQELARRIARLKNLEFGGEYVPGNGHRPLYLVPRESITTLAEARKLGITDEQDLFGGVVPYPFVASKAISHPLVSASATAPEGWVRDFAEEVRDAVLPGFTAFSLADAYTAGLQLLDLGPVRVKAVRATAGRGQARIGTSDELSHYLDCQDQSEIASHGLVLEQHLDDLTTFSVGQVRLGELTVSYYGTQRLTHDNSGAEVYGGSDLTVARGAFDALLALDLAADAKLAIAQAQQYDRAASACYRNFFASRRNYDIARGATPGGDTRSGVLEQSWRIGGASSAEIAALEAFQADPSLAAICTSSLEVFGAHVQLPPEAEILYQGEDPDLGYMTKCVIARPYGE